MIVEGNKTVLPLRVETVSRTKGSSSVPSPPVNAGLADVFRGLGFRPW